MKVVEVKKLTYFYPGRPSPALKDISFTLKKGEFVLVCGETGSGKSTLLACLNGLIPFEAGGTLTGEIYLLGRKGPLPPKEIFPQVTTVFQNPATQILSESVWGEVIFALENLGLSEKEIVSRASQALSFVGLLGLKDLSPRQLSGGQKQRLALAAALAVKPKILILDEPLSQLDPKASKEILSHLKTLASKGLTIVLVEHRIKEVLPWVERILYLKKGFLIFDGSPKEFSPPSRSWPQRQKKAYKKREIVLKVEDLSFAYPGRNPLFEGVSFSFFRGEWVALIGENGSGKSTFLALLAGLLKPTGGKISFLLSPEKGRLTRALLLQDPDLMLFSRSVWEELSFVPKMLKLPKAEKKRRLERILSSLSLLPYAKDPPFSLSRGERLRLALGSLLTGAPQVLLLDEPTTAQDEDNLQKILAHLQAELIVFSTHDEEIATALADRIITFPL